MRIAVVDDERECLEEMTALLGAFGGRRRIQLEPVTFQSAGAFLAAFDRERLPVVFMDIFMEGTDGLAAAARLRELDRRCLLVFLTSSGDFRPEAFSIHAFDYITKPFPPERVYAVLEDALAVLPPAEKYMEVVSGRSVVPVFLHEIVSAVTDAHYVDITLADGGVVRSRMTIQQFLLQTEADPRFIAVNKGIVLNADRISSFEGSCCVMEGGARYPVRVRDRARVEQAVHAYHFASIRSRQSRREERRD